MSGMPGKRLKVIWNNEKTIEELRASLLKIGEQLGGGIRPNYYFTIPDQPDGVGMPYLEISGGSILFCGL